MAIHFLLFLSVLHPFLHYFEQRSQLTVTQWVSFFTFVLVYHYIINLIHALVASVSMHQLSTFIHTKQPSSIKTAFNAMENKWKTIINFSTVTSCYGFILCSCQPLLHRWPYFRAMMGNTRYLIASSLALPCLLFNNLTVVESYREAGTLISEAWGHNLVKNYSASLLSLGLLFVMALPALLGYLMYNGNMYILGTGIGCSAIIYFFTSVFGKLVHNLSVVQLYRYAKEKGNPDPDHLNLDLAFISMHTKTCADSQTKAINTAHTSA